MKQINLLPASVRQKGAKRRQGAALVFTALVAIGCLGVTYVLVVAETGTLTDRIDSLKKQQAGLTAQEHASAPTVILDVDTLSRISQLNTIAKTEIDWSQTFIKTGLLVPKDTRLLSLSYAPSTDGMVLKLSGNAPSNVSFATLYQSLKDNTELKAFNVDTYVYDAKKGTVTFTISATFPISALVFAKQKTQ